MAPNPARELAEELRSAVDDDLVLEAIAATPRADFVPHRLRGRAYENEPLAIGGGQTISQPLVVARMLSMLDIRPGDRVLDVGTGSGWHAALLARLGARVVSLERDATLSARAARNLRLAGVHRVTLHVGDGFEGFPAHAPYDAINVAAATPADALSVLEGQLADRGRLIAPLAGREQRLVLTRRAGDRFERTPLEPVRFVPLVPGLAP